ncbi:MAG TPA: hypothetical protein VIT91_00595 [Chthoniobacterales bacterium]
MAEPTRAHRQNARQLTVGGRYYAEGPSGAPEWGLRFVAAIVFPEDWRWPHPELSYTK